MGERILFVIFLIFSISAAIQIFYYLYFYLSVATYKPTERNSPKAPVSIIICARNEAENLKNFLPSVLEQDYPDFEVIVVNDCSEDGTYKVLGEYLEKYPRLRVSTINKDPKFTHNKKLAQFIGIKAARNELLLFTDADCKPESDKWLESMASNFDDNTRYVLGYGGYLKEKGILNAWIRYDTFVIAMQYFGMAIRGIPYMGVGRNLAYRRSVFFEKKGFGPHSHLASGDDDLFVNSNAGRTDTRVEFSSSSHTRSVASATAEKWLSQKRRHLTTAPYYKTRDKILLITEPLSRMMFYISFVILLSFSYMWIAVLSLFGFRLILNIPVIVQVQKKLRETELLYYSLFFDIFSPLINSVIYFSSKRQSPGKNAWR